jgi:ribulose-5-phosphate 4-epimerase/fuculose-1-phosphate aldolase
MENSEGNIKFKLKWEETGPVITAPMMKSLNTWREIMYSLEMIGAYPDGIGYGNLSARSGNTNRFYISGTATGKFRKLLKKHYCLVKSFDFPENSLQCSGPVLPSSESMTHAAIYSTDPGTGAVYHIHHEPMWESLKGKVPTTPPEARFGTPEMAGALMEIMKDKASREQRIAVMGGHETGVIIWGRDTDEAGKYLLSYYNLIL